MMALYTIAGVRTILDANGNNISGIEALEELSVASFPNVFSRSGDYPVLRTRGHCEISRPCDR
jgi:hypothetical protein